MTTVDMVYKGRFDPARCARRVSQDYSSAQCQRNAVLTEEGFGWCRQHAPSTENAKLVKQAAETALAIWRSTRANLHRAIADAALDGGDVDAACRAYRDHVASEVQP